MMVFVYLTDGKRAIIGRYSNNANEWRTSTLTANDWIYAFYDSKTYDGNTELKLYVDGSNLDIIQRIKSGEIAQQQTQELAIGTYSLGNFTVHRQPRQRRNMEPRTFKR